MSTNTSDPCPLEVNTEDERIREELSNDDHVTLLQAHALPLRTLGDNATGGPTGHLKGDDGRGLSGVIVEVEIDDGRDHSGDQWNECDDVRCLFG